MESAVKEEMVVSLSNAAEAMFQFKMNASAHDVDIITLQATCNFPPDLALEQGI